MKRSRMRRVVTHTIAAGSLIALLALPAGSAVAQPPAFVDQLRCGSNQGWAEAPTVNIDPTNAPAGTVTLVQDAISEYWDEAGAPGPDGEADNPANSGFSDPGPGFGTVTTVVGGDEDIDVSFADLPDGVLGQAFCTVDGNGDIVAAGVELTDDATGLSGEDYKNLAAHELGHTIGLRHRGGPGTLMWTFLISGADAYLPLSGADLRWLDRVYD